MSERETWEIASDARAILEEARKGLQALADAMLPIEGDGYGHTYISESAVTLQERLLFLCDLLSDAGGRLQ